MGEREDCTIGETGQARGKKEEIRRTTIINQQAKTVEGFLAEVVEETGGKDPFQGGHTKGVSVVIWGFVVWTVIMWRLRVLKVCTVLTCGFYGFFRYHKSRGIGLQDV